MENHETWHRVVNQRSRNLLRQNLNGRYFAQHLMAQRVLSPGEYEQSMKQDSSDGQVDKLLDILITKEKFWVPLLHFLEDSGYVEIKEQLQATCMMERELFLAKHSVPQGHSLSLPPTGRSSLPMTDLPGSYVDLDLFVIKDGSLPQQISDRDYNYIWETRGSRIVIEGDPGVGKTTYLCNLATNWALSLDPGNLEHYERFASLRDNLDLVMYVPLLSLDADLSIEGYIHLHAKAPKEDMKAALESNRANRILLLLDGFEELKDGCKQFNNLIQLQHLPNVRVIITTRPSHTSNIRKKHLYLKINGFSRKSAEEYIQKQGLSVDRLQQTFQIPDMSNPGQHLCILDEFGGNPLQLASAIVVTLELASTAAASCDVSEVIIQFIRRVWVKKLSEMFTTLPRSVNNAEFHTVCMKAGKFALAQMKFGRRLVKIQVADMTDQVVSAIKAGLMIDKQRVNYRGAKKRFEFIHPWVACFLAGYYIAKALGENKFEVLWNSLEHSRKAAFQDDPLILPTVYFVHKFSPGFTDFMVQKISATDVWCFEMPIFTSLADAVELNNRKLPKGLQ